MGLLDRLRRRPGDRYDGPAAYCDDYALVPRPDFYALDPTCKKVTKQRLIYVDDAPGDPEDGSGHYEIAGRRDPVQRPGERIVSLGPVVVESHAELTPGVLADVVADPEWALEWVDSPDCVLSPEAKEIVRQLAEEELK